MTEAKIGILEIYNSKMRNFRRNSEGKHNSYREAPFSILFLGLDISMLNIKCDYLILSVGSNSN